MYPITSSEGEEVEDETSQEEVERVVGTELEKDLTKEDGEIPKEEEKEEPLFSEEISEEAGKKQPSPAPEREEILPEIVELTDPKIKIDAFIDLEVGRTAEMRLPLAYGNEEKLPKRNLLTLDGVSAETLGQEIVNLKLIREDGPGRRKVILKGREFRIGFEGTVNPNGSIGMTRLTSYFIHKDLTFKRGVEVYTLIQKLLAGNPVTIRSGETSIVVELSQKFEYLKLLRIVEILYKYYHVAKSLDLNMNEKVDYILKNSKKINELSMLLNERSVDTMVSIEGSSELEKYTGRTLRIIKDEKVKLKNSEISFKKIVEIPDFVLETSEGRGGMSSSWKKAKISYKKVLD